MMKKAAFLASVTAVGSAMGQAVAVGPMTTAPPMTTTSAAWSTVLPCWGGVTTIYDVEQKVTISHSESTTTGQAVLPVPGLYTLPNRAVVSVAAPTMIPYEIEVETDYIVSFNDLGPLAIPGYAGSGLCNVCTPEEYTYYQEVDVIECWSGSCYEHEEIWRAHYAASPTVQHIPIKTSVAAPTNGVYYIYGAAHYYSWGSAGYGGYAGYGSYGAGGSASGGYANAGNGAAVAGSGSAIAGGISGSGVFQNSGNNNVAIVGNGNNVNAGNGNAINGNAGAVTVTVTNAPTSISVDTTVTRTVTSTSTIAQTTVTGTTTATVTTTATPSVAPTQNNATPTPGGGGTTLVIAVTIAGAKQKRQSEQYIVFNGGNAFLTDSKDGAAEFNVNNGLLMSGSGFIGASSDDLINGFGQFRLTGGQPTVSISWAAQEGGGVSFSNSQFTFGGGAAVFCQGDDGAIYAQYTGPTTIGCTPAVLSAVAAAASSTSSTASSTTTSSSSSTSSAATTTTSSSSSSSSSSTSSATSSTATPDPSSDPEPPIRARDNSPVAHPQRRTTRDNKLVRRGAVIRSPNKKSK